MRHTKLQQRLWFSMTQAAFSHCCADCPVHSRLCMGLTGLLAAAFSDGLGPVGHFQDPHQNTNTDSSGSQQQPHLRKVEGSRDTCVMPPIAKYKLTKAMQGCF